ncbi:dynamin [Bacillus ginsengihumi]|uniref:Dynamin n=1 Tax=Heyndrickxia ginsengihumi TaxID=363870 RepID=A0A6M0P7P7_9BACI|nr:dynamin family protein [Heyndrickxia ginsengihumi]NEY20537.1 dynamin [Heyndrickxia ginsengihumi]
MVKLVQKEQHVIVEQILSFIKRVSNNGDHARVQKAKHLLKKLDQQAFHIAFCGHFSAGKSTMINHLVGEQVLPSSPIPTSANLVKVHRANEDFAIVYYDDEQPVYFPQLRSIALIKEFCKQGNVKEVEIGKANTILPDSVVVMDTPGVDSTDDAHRIATESAIYLADMVFYVMDYNHVQSELNFQFTKELLNHGMELYLVINQIDKHHDEELSFAEFSKSVQQAFATWDVHPKGIFFTSLKHPDNSHNQIKELQAFVQQTVDEKDIRITHSIESSLHILEDEHMKWLDEMLHKQIAPYEQVLEHVAVATIDASSCFQQEQDLQNERKRLLSIEDAWARYFQTELEKVLKNAYLMPFETRELAKSYLETTQQDFKVGVLFTKKKTEEERKKRLHLFFEKLQKDVESQLTWHIRSLAATALKELNIKGTTFAQDASSLTVTFDEHLLEANLQKGARLTGEYILHYCDDVSASIKKIALKLCNGWKEQVLGAYRKEIATQLSKIETELANISTLADAFRSIQYYKGIYEENIKLLQVPLDHVEQLLPEIRQEWENERQQMRVYDESLQPDVIKKETGSSRENKPFNIDETQSVHQSETLIEKMDRAIELLANKHSFTRYIQHLQDKKKRLENQEYTIALFGAFSAGKSSFANALLGEKVLPVSPNPTTAAINRICPVSEEHKHGTANVHLKTADQLLDDVRNSLKVFNLDCQSLIEANEQIRTLKRLNKSEGRENIHLSFLLAFAKGFEQYKEQLGQTLETNIQQFQAFVANEEQSCFVESIDLYYDVPFTRMGITLVDTPGADSINARHTGVAFEYIKESDAILFVTYYNHAFAKADREFLIQLGRVKDAFELDKMFFIVNAIDLAESEEELHEVLDYVNDQLTQYGIRFPRLFGISSLLAINGEVEQSKLPHFQKAFEQFLQYDLLKMVLQSAEKELERGKQMVDAIISSASESNEQKAERKRQLHTARKQIEQLLLDAKPDQIITNVKQEKKELLFYVKQRVFYRFPDFFKEAFNPATVYNREGLKHALAELLDSVGYDFAQEFRATTLRLEAYSKKMFHQVFAQLEKEIQILNNELSMTDFELENRKTPEFPNAFQHINNKPLEQTFKHFKNAKSFFEKNEKQAMQEELQSLLELEADIYLQSQDEKLESMLQTWIKDEHERMIAEIIADITEQFEGWFEALEQTVNVEEWKHISKLL